MVEVEFAEDAWSVNGTYGARCHINLKQIVYYFFRTKIWTPGNTLYVFSSTANLILQQEFQFQLPGTKMMLSIFYGQQYYLIYQTS